MPFSAPQTRFQGLPGRAGNWGTLGRLRNGRVLRKNSPQAMQLSMRRGVGIRFE